MCVALSTTSTTNKVFMTSDSSKTYERVIAWFDALKKGEEAASDRTALTIRLADGRIAKLRPLPGKPASILQEDIRALTVWRNLHRTAFLTQFTATEERTRAWVTKVLAFGEDRILFMIDDANGKPVGHIGLKRFQPPASLEVDNVIRGGGYLKGVMEKALCRVCALSELEVGILQHRLCVFKDNDRALRLYRKCGFEDAFVRHLKRHEKRGTVHWIETQNITKAERTLLYMIRPGLGKGGD